MDSRGLRGAEVRPRQADSSHCGGLARIYLHGAKGMYVLEFTRISHDITQARAIFDAEASWQDAFSLTGFDDGNSKTNTLWWIATRGPHATPAISASARTNIGNFRIIGGRRQLQDDV